MKGDKLCRPMRVKSPLLPAQPLALNPRSLWRSSRPPIARHPKPGTQESKTCLPRPFSTRSTPLASFLLLRAPPRSSPLPPSRFNFNTPTPTRLVLHRKLHPPSPLPMSTLGVSSLPTLLPTLARAIRATAPRAEPRRLLLPPPRHSLSQAFSSLYLWTSAVRRSLAK